jgi:hypothetical protein
MASIHMASRPAPEYDESRWLLKALRETAHELESQVWGLDEDELRWRPDDGWCLKEIAAHLRDCEEHLLRCLELIAGRDDPRIPAFDADALVLDNHYTAIDVYDALQQFESLRYRSVHLLWGLEPEDWGRIGVHPYAGPVTIQQLAREQSQHDLEHLWQARGVRQALEARAPARRR